VLDEARHDHELSRGDIRADADDKLREALEAILHGRSVPSEGLSEATANLCGVSRRALPVALVLIAALFDSLARPGFAFYALLVAVPLAAFAALSALGEMLDGTDRAAADGLAALDALLWGTALTLIVAATSARAGVLDGLPAGGFAQPALIACLGTLALESLVAVVSHARRPLLVSES